MPFWVYILLFPSENWAKYPWWPVVLGEIFYCPASAMKSSAIASIYSIMFYLSLSQCYNHQSTISDTGCQYFHAFVHVYCILNLYYLNILAISLTALLDSYFSATTSVQHDSFLMRNIPHIDTCDQYFNNCQ